MDPLTTILVGLTINVGTDIWRRIWDSKQQAVIPRDTGSPVFGGAYDYFIDASRYSIHTVTVGCVPGDDWVAQWVDATNPCLFVLAAETFLWVQPCTIEDQFVLELPGGYYQIGLLAYNEHPVNPDLMQLVAWQAQDVQLAMDQHVILPVRLDPGFLGSLGHGAMS